MKKGIFIVISGPSGVGKTTICNKLSKLDNIWYSVSVTTRKKRANEKEGIQYYFTDVVSFKEKIECGEFFEYSIYDGNYYGTLKSTVTSKLDKGISVISEIDVAGAKNIKKLYEKAILIYIHPPSYAELENRLLKRGTEDKEKIRRRIEMATLEINNLEGYDYELINYDIDKTIDEIINILNSLDGKIN